MSKASKLFIRLNNDASYDYDIAGSIDNICLLSDSWQWNGLAGNKFRISVADIYGELLLIFAISTSCDIYYREEDVDGITDTKVWSGYVVKESLQRMNYELQFDVVDKFIDLVNTTVDYATIGTDTDNASYKQSNYIELTTAIKSAMRDASYSFDWEYPTNTTSLHRVMFANDFGNEKIVDIFYSKTLNYTIIATEYSVWILKYYEGESSMYGGSWMLKKVYTSSIKIYKFVYTFQGEAVKTAGLYDYVYLETQSEPTGSINEKHCAFIIRLRYYTEASSSTFQFKDAPAMFATDNTDPDNAVPYADGGKYIVSGTPVLRLAEADNEVMYCVIKKDTAKDLSFFVSYFNSDYSNGIWTRNVVQTMIGTMIPYYEQVDSKWVIILVSNTTQALINSADLSDITAAYHFVGFDNLNKVNKTVAMWHSNGVDKYQWTNDLNTAKLYTITFSVDTFTATDRGAGVNEENAGLLTNGGFNRYSSVQMFHDGTVTNLDTQLQSENKMYDIDYALPFLTYINAGVYKFNLLFHSTTHSHLFITLYGTDTRLYITDNAGVQNGSIFDLILNYGKPVGMVCRYNLTLDKWEFVNYDYASTLHTLDSALIDNGEIVESYYQTDYKEEFEIKTPYRLISKNGYGKKVVYTVSMEGDWQGIFTALAVYFTTRRTQFSLRISGFLKWQAFDRITYRGTNYRLKSIFHKVDRDNNITLVELEEI